MQKAKIHIFLSLKVELSNKLQYDKYNLLWMLNLITGVLFFVYVFLEIMCVCIK